jgi:hypothetical protein
MYGPSKYLLTIGVALLVSGCAGIPKVQLAAESRLKIKTIAVAAAPEPARYFFEPAQLQAGYILYAFGGIGGIVRRGIEASRAENATIKFNTEISKHPPSIGSLWTNELVSALSQKSYAVQKVPTPPKIENSTELDCTKVEGKFDAIFLTSIEAGYANESQMEPRVILTARLMSGDCKDVLYSEQFLYGARQLVSMVLVERDPSHSFATWEALQADPNRASQVLRAGISALVRRVTSDF